MDRVFEHNWFVGESAIFPEILTRFAEDIEDVVYNLGYEANVTMPSRLGGCTYMYT